MNSEFKKTSQRLVAGIASAGRFAKRCAPLALLIGAAAVRCYAGQSPMAQWFTDMSAEATGTWAIAGTVIGMTLGLLGIKFGGHEMKRKSRGAVCHELFPSVRAGHRYLSAIGVKPHMDQEEFEAMSTAAEREEMQNAYGRDWNDADQAADRLDITPEEAVEFLREHEETVAAYGAGVE